MQLRYLYLILLGLSLWATSCLKDEDTTQIIIDPVEEPSILLWSGEDSLLALEGDPRISEVTSDNHEVIKATLENHQIRLSAGIPGNTSIRFTNDTGRSFVRTVHSMVLQFQWRSVHNDATYRNSAVVEAADPTFAGTLQAELSAFANDTFLLDFRAEDSLYRQVIPAEKKIVEGHYAFRQLTLKLQPSDAEEEIYKVIPYANREVLALEQDLTAHYQALHPDKGIRTVKVTRHIKYRPYPG